MVTDDLFLSVSNIIGIRVTPDTVRSKFDDIASTGGITPKVKTDMLKEILIAFSKLEQKVDETRNPANTNTV